MCWHWAIHLVLFACCQWTITCRAQLKENIYFNRLLSIFCCDFSISAFLQLNTWLLNWHKMKFLQRWMINGCSCYQSGSSHFWVFSGTDNLNNKLSSTFLYTVVYVKTNITKWFFKGSCNYIEIFTPQEYSLKIIMFVSNAMETIQWNRLNFWNNCKMIHQCQILKLAHTSFVLFLKTTNFLIRIKDRKKNN